MDSYKIPIQPLEAPFHVYIRKQASALWIAQSEYFFSIPILGAKHNAVRLEPGTPIKLPTSISEVYVCNGRFLIDWMFEGGRLDITNVLYQDENGGLHFKAHHRHNSP